MSGLDAVVVRRWPRQARCVGQARRELRRELAAWGLKELADTAELVLSELFGNAVRHALGPVDRQVETRYEPLADGGVRIEVHDASGVHPERQDASADAESGRGLALVDALTGGQWGVGYREGVGKMVWAECGVADGGTEAGR